MNLRKFALSLLCTLFAGAAAEAQILQLYSTVNGGAAYDRSIGNSSLGAGVHGHCYLQRRTGIAINYARTSVDAQLRAYANLLGSSTNILDATANVAETRTMTGTTGVGACRLRVLNFDLINRSFTTNTSVNNSWSTLNAFGVSPSLSVGVGPFTLSLRGNLGAGIAASANLNLSPTSLQVSTYGTFSCYGQARGVVAIGIPYLCEGGVRLDGRVFDQELVLFCGVTPTSFTGTAIYRLTPLVLRLQAWIDGLCVGFFEQSTTLATWSSGSISRTLF